MTEASGPGVVTRFIGDVHGKLDAYACLRQGCAASVQVGDLGVGFVDVPDLGPGHRFIRGNHDSPALCRTHSSWIPDATLEGGNFYLGGASSIDRWRRHPGNDVWDDEELSWGELSQAIDAYLAAQPVVVITHDGPEEVTTALLGGSLHRSRTAQALQAMLDGHRPSLWVFGHWHRRVDAVVGDTRFVCLEELGVLDVALPTG